MMTKALRVVAAFAVALVAVAFSQVAALALEPATCANGWANIYDKWSVPITSYLFVTPEDTLQRVNYTGGQLVVEDLKDETGAVASQLVIDPATYSPSDLGTSALVWGGAFCGSDANYVVTGQANPEEDDNLVVFRVTKYSKSWAYVSACEVVAANTYGPFDAGMCVMTELAGKLYVRTCHTMYDIGDGLHHQASMLLVIDEQSMSLELNGSAIKNLSSSTWGYVSHSFNQRITQVNGSVFFLDHGDAYPRSAVIKRFGATGTSSYTDVFPIYGGTGDNTTGVSVGGFEGSATRSTLLVAGNSVDQDAYAAADSTDGLVRNVWLTVTSADLTSTEVKMLSSYTDDGRQQAGTPHLVKVSDDRFLVMWNVIEQLEYEFIPGDVFLFWTNGSTLRYVFVNGAGELLSDVMTADAILSDCQPILWNGKVLWYSSSDTEGIPSYYEIDGTTGAFTAHRHIGSASITKVNFSYVYDYDSGTSIDGISYYDYVDGVAYDVKFGTQELVEGKDYEVTSTIDLDAKIATFTFTGLGEWGGTKVVTEKVVKSALKSADIEIEGTFTYTGEQITPVPRVSYKGVELRLDKDYTLSWKDNVDYGSGTVTITATNTGVLFGEVERRFSIWRKNLSGAEVTVEDAMYTPTGAWPEVTVTLDGTPLVRDRDYVVNTENNYGAGTAYVTVYGTGNYQGSVAKVEFTIHPVDISAATLTITDETYTGYEIEPDIEGSYQGDKLYENYDFELVELVDNVDAGTATVTIKGIGNYTGEITATFTILPADIEDAWIDVDDQVYTGSALTPEVRVYVDWVLLVEGVDCRITFANNTDIGTAKVTVVGLGNYTGTANTTFKIAAGHAAGWFKEDGAWYYYERTGLRRTNNWAEANGTYYYLGSNGKIVVNGWATYNDRYYFMGANGKAVVSNWVTYAGRYYYMDKYGNPVIDNWVQYGGKWYYMNGSGNPVVNDWIEYEGARYHFNANGVCDRKA